jgi:hypothetical protein
MKKQKRYDCVAEMRKIREINSMLYLKNPELFKQKLKGAFKRYHERVAQQIMLTQ